MTSHILLAFLFLTGYLILAEYEKGGFEIDCMGPVCDIKFEIREEVYSYRVVKIPGGVYQEKTTIGLPNGQRLWVARDLEMKESRFQTPKTESLDRMATVSMEFLKGNWQINHAVFTVNDQQLLTFERAGWEEETPAEDEHSVRRLKTVRMDWKKSVGLPPKETHFQMALDAFASPAAKLRGLQETTATSFFDPLTPNACYAGDGLGRVAQISVIVDYGFYLTAKGTLKNEAIVSANVAQRVDDLSALAQLVWSAQMNVDIKIIHVEIGGAASQTPLNWAANLGTCTGNALDAMYQIRNTWLSTRQGPQWGGVVVFLSSCIGSDGIAGIAETYSYCRDISVAVAAVQLSSVDFAHELGHVFGASHTFQDGVGSTGGLMDYGNGKYQGQYQFHPANKPQVCYGLKMWSDSNCPWLKLRTSTSTCGNGVIEPNEACECFDGTTSCGKCVNCQTVGAVQCSTRFAFRFPSNKNYIAVTTLLLASAECCTNEALAAPKSRCGAGSQNVCSIGGLCQPICSRYGYTSCALDSNGCLEMCNINGVCRAVLASGNLQPLSALTNGTSCAYAGQLGTCQSGQCSSAPKFGPVTKAPTPAPTFGGNIRTTTMTPSLSPQSPTSSPTSMPTITLQPTLFQPKEMRVGCDVRTNQRSCSSRRVCQWCGKLNSCFSKSTWLSKCRKSVAKN